MLAIVLGSGVTGDDSSAGTAGTRAPATATATDDDHDHRRKQTQRSPATYTIKANDTLSGIAARRGLTVERLQELNPELDPQGLVAGQKIKLRE